MNFWKWPWGNLLLLGQCYLLSSFSFYSDFGLSLNSNSPGKQTIASYLCPTLNHHPWCPSRTGDHGFIFVGLGKDKDSYHPSAIRHLFIGLPKTGIGSRRFRYLGKYKVTRADPLSVDEWAMLSADVSAQQVIWILWSYHPFFQFKSIYVKLTKDKTKDARTLEDIRAAYDSGDIRVPCVQLQCIGFDDNFFTALLSERDAESPASWPSRSDLPWFRWWWSFISLVPITLFLNTQVFLLYLMNLEHNRCDFVSGPMWKTKVDGVM